VKNVDERRSRVYAAEAVRCPPLKAPAKTSLDCITHPVFGGTAIERCELSCRGASRFSAASIGGHWTTATQCGAHTGYRWTHEIQNVSLLACSGKLKPSSIAFYFTIFYDRNSYIWSLILKTSEVELRKF